MDSEHALNSFFNVVYQQGLIWTGEYNPYFLAKDDWTTLVAISTAQHQTVGAHRENRAVDLCWQSKTIHTPAQLGAALEDNARTAKELAAAYRTELDSELSPEGRVIVDQAINRLPDHLHTVNLDHTAYFSAAPIEPGELSRVVVQSSNDAPGIRLTRADARRPEARKARRVAARRFCRTRVPGVF